MLRFCVVVSIVLSSVALQAQEAVWKQHMAGAAQALAEKGYKAAVTEAENAVAAAEKAFGAMDERLAASLELLADALVGAGRVGDGEARFRQAIVIRQKMSGQIISIRFGLEDVYLDQSTCASRVTLVQGLLANVATNPLPDSVSAGLLDLLGRCQRTLGRLEESEASLRRSLAIRIAQGPSALRQGASVAEALAILLQTQLRHVEAADAYRQASRMLEEIPPSLQTRTDALTIGRELHGMGNELTNAGDYDTADACFARWAAFSASLGVTDLLAFSDLARLRALQGYYAEAEALAQKDTNRTRGLMQGSPLPGAYSVLGAIYRDSGDYAAAEKILQRALEVSGPGSVAGLIRLTLGDVYRGMQRYLEADSSYESAKTILAAGPGGTKSPRYGMAVGEMGYLRLKQGSRLQAETLLGQALEVVQAAYGTKHPLSARLKWYVAQLREGQGRYEQADQHYREAIQAMETSLGVERPVLAPLLNDFARFLRTRKETAEAAAVEKRAAAAAALRTYSPGKAACVTVVRR